ncbi:hypothetical protein ACJDU8_07240 [Clostridium sp. WILCCON 0269]|uniref:Uncharacterized protein n=1 Tax=Candidatus Clostridium eludens TaxID=3381663 RepID=A0ABW8SHJ7_9CLOT
MNGNLILNSEDEYRTLADKYKIPCTEIYAKHLTGDIALIIANIEFGENSNNATGILNKGIDTKEINPILS